MTFAPSVALTQEAVGLRMEFVSQNADIRNDALTRLQKGRDPMAVAYALTGKDMITGDKVIIDLFKDDMASFAGKLDRIKPNWSADYRLAEGQLDANKRDTPENREHVRDFWEQALTDNNANLTAAMRAAFIAALAAPDAVKVRWGPPAVSHGAAKSAEYDAANRQIVMTTKN